jgi:hypothetical protein
LSRASRNTSTLIATLCNVSNGTVSYDIIDILASWLIYARETGGVQKPGKNCINGCLFADPLFLFGGAEWDARPRSPESLRGMQVQL